MAQAALVSNNSVASVVVVVVVTRGRRIASWVVLSCNKTCEYFLSGDEYLPVGTSCEYLPVGTFCEYFRWIFFLVEKTSAVVPPLH